MHRLIFNPESCPARKNRDGLAFFLLAVLVLIVYSNNYHCSWHFDDFNIILNNVRVHLHSLNSDSILGAFFAHPNGEGLYRPIPMLSFAFNWLWGQDNTWGYHLINNIVHALNACFLYITIQLLFLTPVGKNEKIGNPYFIALLSAVLWAVHPIHTQAVTYVVQRMAAMAAMFYILSLLFYLKSRLESLRLKRIIFAVCCAVSAVFGVLSKENAIMLPFSILLVEFAFFNNIKKSLYDKIKNQRKERLYLFAAGIFLSILIVSWFSYVSIFNTIADSYSKRPFTMSERILTEPRVIFFYLSLIIYPTPDRFSINHIFSFSESLWDPITTLLSLLVLSFIFIFSVSQIRRRPFLAFSILFFLSNHVIESSFIGLELIYEHRNYLPSFFIFIPLSLIIYKSFEVYSQKSLLVYSSLITLCISIIFIFGISSHLRNTDWKSERTLWESVLKLYPNSTRALHNLAYGYYGRKGDYKEALRLYSKALSLDWSDNSAVYRKGITYNNVAGIYYGLGKDEMALNAWNKAIEIYPSYTKAIVGKTQALISLGKWNGAIKSLEDIPDEKQTAKSINMKAFILYKQEKYYDAIRSVQKALKLNPSNLESLLYLGAIYSKLENYPKSRFYLRVAYSQSQDLSILLLLLENAILLDDSAAIEKYKKIATKPSNREKVYSILRFSKRNEKISLSIERIIPIISDETIKNTNDWIKSIGELIVY